MRAAKRLIRENIRLFPNEDDNKSSEGTKSQHSEETQKNPPTRRPKLPELPIPTFNGSYAKWIPFKQMFGAMIERCEDLQDIEKLQYLKMALTGEPSQLLEHLEVNDDNYQIAWEMLTEQYQNLRAIVDNHISALLELKPMNKESASELNKLIQESTSHISALKALKQPLGDSYIVNLIASRLDITTRKYWEEQINETLPTWDEMRTSLMKRYRLLETIEHTQPETKLSGTPTTSSNTKKPPSRTLFSSPDYQSTFPGIVHRQIADDCFGT